MKPVLITASTPFELSLLLEKSGAVAMTGVGRLQAYRGKIAEREVVIAVTGLGKVNASSATTVLLESFDAALVINTGCGGAFPGCSLALGDLAVASSETFADEGVQTPDGWRGLDLIGIPVVKGGGDPIFNTIPLAPSLAESALQSARGQGFGAERGPFLTVSTCSGTDAQGAELLRRFPGICENMEGAAVAQVAHIYQVPLLEVRGISNFVEDRDLSRWDLKGAVTRVQRFLFDFLEDSSLPF